MNNSTYFRIYRENVQTARVAADKHEYGTSLWLSAYDTTLHELMDPYNLRGADGQCPECSMPTWRGYCAKCDYQLEA